jgi:hypothetical protein
MSDGNNEFYCIWFVVFRRWLGSGFSQLVTTNKQKPGFRIVCFFWELGNVSQKNTSDFAISIEWWIIEDARRQRNSGSDIPRYLKIMINPEFVIHLS